MSKNLVIVESPAKAKTIEKFLGKDFRVESSFGHIADLPSKELGVNVEVDFKPKYQISKDKREVVKKLKGLADKAEMVWLASDEDREGEAIAWHLYEVLKLKPDNTKRIVFSGDLGAPYTPILSMPQSPYQADIVVLESTYGDRIHSGRKDRRYRLFNILKKLLSQKFQ